MTRATFIGHQSWLLEIGGARVLVDPMLTSSFGHSQRLRFEVHPARAVDVARIPDLDAVVVTNEHLDHFHLPSLAVLPQGVPVIMPHLVPRVCVDAARDAGLEVRLVEPCTEVEVGDASLFLIPGAHGIPVWESRVVSVYARSRKDRHGGVFVQSDTAVSPPPTDLGCTPEVFIATHNAQVPPAGQLGAFDNLLPVPSPTPTETTGLDLLHGVLKEATSHFATVRHVLLSGGGYTQVPAKHGEFLWNDFKELAVLANQLSLDVRVVGLDPGEAVCFSPAASQVERVPWVLSGEASVTVAASDPNATDDVDLGADLPPLFGGALTRTDQELVLTELNRMAPLLMLSPLGRRLIAENTYLDQPVGAWRFAVHLRGWETDPDGDDGSRVLALNMNSARFEPTDINLREALFTVPSGIDVNAVDLIAVLRGDVHIWELAVSRLRQWYTGERLESPIGFLYGALSEQVRPDLAAKLYQRLRQLDAA